MNTTDNLQKFEENLLVIRPCHTKGKLMGEGNLKDITEKKGIDIKKIENRVLEFKDVKNIIYSENLGLLKYSQGDKSVFIFETGFVRVKNAADKKDIIKTVAFLKNNL